MMLTLALLIITTSQMSFHPIKNWTLTDPVNKVLFFDDDEFVVAVQPKKIQILSIYYYNLIQERSFSNRITDVEVKNRRILVATTDGKVALYNDQLEQKHSIRYPIQNEYALDLAWTDSNTLAIAGRSNQNSPPQIHLYSVSENRITFQKNITTGFQAGSSIISVSSDNEFYLAAFSSDNDPPSVEVYSFDSFQMISQIDVSGLEVSEISFSAYLPNHLALLSHKFGIFIWEIKENGGLSQYYQTGSEGKYEAYNLERESTVIFGQKNRIFEWNYLSGQEESEMIFSQAKPLTIDLNQKQNYMAVGTDNGLYLLTTNQQTNIKAAIMGGFIALVLVGLLATFWASHTKTASIIKDMRTTYTSTSRFFKETSMQVPNQETAPA